MTKKNVHAIIKRALSKSSADFKYLSGRFGEKLVTYDEGPLPRVICDKINLGCIIKKINVGEKGLINQFRVIASEKLNSFGNT